MKSGVSVRVPRERAAECVSGVLISDCSVLVEKRRVDDDADPGLVLLPGGHVEVGESLNRALKREMREELGIKVERSHRFASVTILRQMERGREYITSKSRIGGGKSGRTKQRLFTGNQTSTI